MKFYNKKQEMNLEKGAVSKRKLKIYVKNYIFELFKILQFKTKMNLEKGNSLEANFAFFLMNDCFI